MKKLSIETLISLLEIPGMGRKKTRVLIGHLPENGERAFREIVNIGIKQKIIKEPISETVLRSCQDRAIEILEKNDRYGIKVLSFMDDDYPSVFNFTDGPILIYYLGNRECLIEGRRVAVIGSRQPQQIGRKFAFSIAKSLAKENGIVVSGLAIGCDTAAHQGCLSAGGQTIAFLPSGLLNIYPFGNRDLAEEILDKSGCLLSEYPLAAKVKSFHFIERDRLQAGVSDFLVVSTFSQKGGTLHTLKYAHSYSKKIVTNQEIVNQVPKSFSKLSDLGISYEILSDFSILKKLSQ